jgi:hypothetical protein
MPPDSFNQITNKIATALCHAELNYQIANHEGTHMKIMSDARFQISVWVPKLISTGFTKNYENQ